jgi:prophage antirepressor-like protein
MISKSYDNEELNLSLDAFIDSNQNVYFKGKEVALALGYQNPKEAVTDHVRSKHKMHFRDFTRGANRSPLKMHPDQVLITEPGIYSLIFGSKMPIAEKFQDWVCDEVLPSIRKYGQYKAFDNPNPLVFKIENEFDLHTKVVNYIKRFYSLLIIAGLGELQDSKSKRIKSWQKGYQKGQPDIIINTTLAFVLSLKHHKALAPYLMLKRGC